MTTGFSQNATKAYQEIENLIRNTLSDWQKDYWGQEVTKTSEKIK
ncbi:MAG: hypothetical protein SGJ02_01640 [bacterium]|nr:hypothetical protein [bacterium]